jgi:hypothetical protein
MYSIQPYDHHVTERRPNTVGTLVNHHKIITSLAHKHKTYLVSSAGDGDGYLCYCLEGGGRAGLGGHWCAHDQLLEARDGTVGIDARMLVAYDVERAPVEDLRAPVMSTGLEAQVARLSGLSPACVGANWWVTKDPCLEVEETRQPEMDVNNGDATCTKPGWTPVTE